MGYTHYWHYAGEPVRSEDWLKIMQDASKLLNIADTTRGIGELRWEDGDKRPPEVSFEMIRFNGIGVEAHETFLLEQNEGGFCKTAQKPYDMVVVCILACAVEHAPYALEVSSDGDDLDWKTGLDWGSAVLGRELKYPCGEG